MKNKSNAFLLVSVVFVALAYWLGYRSGSKQAISLTAERTEFVIDSVGKQNSSLLEQLKKSNDELLEIKKTLRTMELSQ